MTARLHRRASIATAIATAFAAGTVSFCLAALPAAPAYAVTAAEKQAEADEAWAQIDALQTSLNEAQAEYDQAVAAHDEAVEKRDDAQRRMEEATARIEELQEKLSRYAVANYKRDEASYLDVLLQTTSFSEFMTSLDSINAVSNLGVDMIEETKALRVEAEEARAEFEEQSQVAEQQMAEAEERKSQIEETQATLREEASRLSQEAAELAYQEELEAEAARQAEEARIQREAELAAAAQGAVTTSSEVAAGASVVMGTGYFTHPLPSGVISSEFGYRTFDNSFHMGLDLAAEEGTPYYAADSGTVMYATNDGGYNGGAGNWVVIAHGNGIVTKYMHSSATFVVPGDQVSRGQNIGLVGNTGNSFGAHLHFQVEVDGVAVNPLNYL
jgi:murein DD-endopeptidase MepM/ murein hydrolase activator NlpD